MHCWNEKARFVMTKPIDITVKMVTYSPQRYDWFDCVIEYKNALATMHCLINYMCRLKGLENETNEEI